MRNWLISKLGGFTPETYRFAVKAIEDGHRETIEGMMRDAETVSFNSEYVSLVDLTINGNVTINASCVAVFSTLVKGDLALPPNAELRLHDVFAHNTPSIGE